MAAIRKQMHQTTVRFDSELWRRVDEESRRIGVSAAQYIRDSTLIRLTTEGRAAGSALVQANANSAISAAGEIKTESQAVWAQARLARERARGLRAASRRLAEVRAERAWAGNPWLRAVSTEGS